MQNEQPYYGGSGHTGHYQARGTNYTAPAYGQGEFRGAPEAPAPPANCSDENSLEFFRNWWRPTGGQNGDEWGSRSRPSDQGGPQGPGGSAPCGMGPGAYGGGAPYVDGAMRGQIPGDARGGYSPAVQGDSRGINASGMDPSSGWYQGARRPYPSDGYAPYHQGPPQNGGMPPPQPSIPPPQPGMPPPHAGMPPPHGGMPPQSVGMVPQGGTPQGGMQPPQQLIPIQSAGPGGMPSPQGGMQPPQRVMQPPQGVMQPPQAQIQGMPPQMNSCRPEDSGNYLAPRMGHGAQGGMGIPSVPTRQLHHAAQHAQPQESSHVPFQPGQQSVAMHQSPSLNHQPPHPSNAGNYSACTVQSSQPSQVMHHTGGPQSPYVAHHDNAVANQHQYSAHHQPAPYVEQHQPLQPPEQAPPMPPASQMQPQSNTGRPSSSQPNGTGSRSSFSGDSGAWTTPDPGMLYNPPEALQALQRMATDLLGPNDWGKLPPEQLWNVLKVTIEHSFSSSKTTVKPERAASSTSSSADSAPAPAHGSDDREHFARSNTPQGMARARDAGAAGGSEDAGAASAGGASAEGTGSSPQARVQGDGGQGLGGPRGDDEHQRRLQLLQEVDQYQSYLLNVVRESEIFNEAEEQEEAREMEASLMQIRRTSSGRAYPIPTPFIMKGVATGVSVLFPRLEKNGLIDIDVLVQHCPCPLQLDGSQIVGLAGGSTLLERGKQSKSKTRGQARQGKETERESLALLPSDKAGNRMQHACTVNMMLAGGGDYVSVKVYSNGKTQTTGCKSIDMVYAANRLLLEALRAIAHMDYPDAKTRPCLHINAPPDDRAALQQVVTQAVENPGEAINLIKAPVQGVFDCGFKGVGVKLDMKALCEYLSTAKHAAKVALIKECRQEGNSSRFKQLCLYVRREAVPSWKDSDGGQATAYVALFDTGKCNINAAPNETVAHDIAQVVTDILIDAFGQDHIRLRLDEDVDHLGPFKRPKTDP